MENKKELLKKFKEEQQKKFAELLPIPVEKIIELFDYLNEVIDECDDDLHLTRQFLIENNLPIHEVIEWLEANGGFCDCEVLANVEANFEEMKLV